MSLPDETHDLPIVMFEDEPAETFRSMESWAIWVTGAIAVFLLSALLGLLAGLYAAFGRPPF